MTEVAQIFTYTDRPVRTVVVDGQPWFVLADICAVLGIANPRNVAARVPDRRKGVRPVDTPGGTQSLNVVDEPGAYMVVMRSDKPAAVEFQEWLAEVATEIRRTGRYELQPPPAPATFDLASLDIADPQVVLLIGQAAQQSAQQAITERALRHAAETQLAIVAPKAESWDQLASANGDWSVADAAKSLSRDPNINLGERRLFNYLASIKWAFRQRGDNRWRAYQDQINLGRLSEMPASHFHPRTGELIWDAPQVRITPKGLHELHARLGGAPQLAISP